MLEIPRISKSTLEVLAAADSVYENGSTDQLKFSLAKGPLDPTLTLVLSLKYGTKFGQFSTSKMMKRYLC